MPGLVPGIHVFLPISKKDVDGRVKPGHDENDSFSRPRNPQNPAACFARRVKRASQKHCSFRKKEIMI
jgi:hypothetical protein